MRKMILWILAGMTAPIYGQVVGSQTGYCVNGATSAIVSGLSSTNTLQGVVPSCKVTVYLTGTTTLATIYSNISGGTLSNPFTASTKGAWIFYAASGQFDVVLSGGYPPNVYANAVTLTGLVVGSGGSSTIFSSPFNKPTCPTGASASSACTATQIATGIAGGSVTLSQVSGTTYVGPSPLVYNTLASAVSAGATDITLVAPQTLSVTSTVNLTSGKSYHIHCQPGAVLQNGMTSTSGYTNVLVSGIGLTGFDFDCPVDANGWVAGAQVAISNSSNINIHDAQDFDSAAVVVTGNTTANSTTITNISNTDPLAIGKHIFGLGVDPDHYITAISGTTITLNNPATRTITADSLTVGSVSLSYDIANSSAIDMENLSGFSYQAVAPITGLNMSKITTNGGQISILAEAVGGVTQNVHLTDITSNGPGCLAVGDFSNPALASYARTSNVATVTTTSSNNIVQGQLISPLWMPGYVSFSNTFNALNTPVLSVSTTSGVTTVTYASVGSNVATKTWTQPGPFTVSSVANASAGNTVYTGTFTGGASNAFAGLQVAVSGLASNNIGVYTVIASTATTLTLNNSAGTAQTAAGTVYVYNPQILTGPIQGLTVKGLRCHLTGDSSIAFTMPSFDTISPVLSDITIEAKDAAYLNQPGASQPIFEMGATDPQVDQLVINAPDVSGSGNYNLVQNYGCGNWGHLNLTGWPQSGNAFFSYMQLYAGLPYVCTGLNVHDSHFVQTTPSTTSPAFSSACNYGAGYTGSVLGGLADFSFHDNTVEGNGTTGNAVLVQNINPSSCPVTNFNVHHNKFTNWGTAIFSGAEPTLDGGGNIYTTVTTPFTLGYGGTTIPAQFSTGLTTIFGLFTPTTYANAQLCNPPTGLGDLVNISDSTTNTQGAVISGGGSYGVFAGCTSTGYVVLSGTGGGGGSSAFSSLTSGTNSAAAMVVGTGASLAASGSGTIAATSAPASGLTGATLASGVTGSSLTGLGTVSSGTWHATIVGAAYGGTGVANTATLTLGTSNHNYATLGTGIIKNTTTTGALSLAASSDVIGLWSGTCNTGTFLRGDGSCQSISGSGTVTSFAAPSGSWPSWLVPTVTNTTTTPLLAVAASAIPNASLATQAANTVLGALTATTPSGISLPSCSGASNALIWTSGTGFGCNTISGGGSPAFNSITSGTNTTAAMVVGSGGSLAATGSGTIAATTAAALAATPSQCSSGQFATGVTAAGAANCSTPSGGGGTASTWVTNMTGHLTHWTTCSAAVLAGTGGTRCKIAIVGDSTSAGVTTGATTDYRATTSYPSQLVGYLNISGYPAEQDNWWGDANDPTSDGRLTLGGSGSWSGAGGFGGPMFQGGSGGSCITFAPRTNNSYNKLDVEYYDSGSPVFTVQVNGGTTYTVTGGNTGSLKQQTVTFGSAVVPTSLVTCYSSGGTLYLSGEALWSSTTPYVEVYNGGSGGSDSAGWSTTGGYGLNEGWLITAPQLTIIDLGTNDINNGSPSMSAYATNLQNMVTQANGINSDVILYVPQPFTSSNYLTDIYTLTGNLYSIATSGSYTKCCAFLNMSLPYNYSTTLYDGLGYSASSLHPTVPFYAIPTQQIAHALTGK